MAELKFKQHGRQKDGVMDYKILFCSEVQKDIEDIRQVYHYVKERNFTLEGAKERIKADRGVDNEKFAIIKRLKFAKSELEKIYRELDEITKEDTNK